MKTPAHSARCMLICILLLLLGTFVAATAQNESGLRPLYKPGFKGAWYDSTTSGYQGRYPIIRSLPPLSLSMPYEVLLSYIVADSLARFGSDSIGWVIGNVMTEWMRVGALTGTLNDTLKNMLRGIYWMTDYNPVLLEQFMTEIALKSGRDKRYHMAIHTLIWKAMAALEVGVPTAEKKAYYSVIRADHVLRVKILAIDSMICKSCIISKYEYRATAQVLDTIKGKVFQPAVVDLSALDRKTGDRAMAGSAPLIQFVYQPINYTDPGEVTSDHNYDYMYRDSAFLDFDGRRFRMRPGQEAIVFATYGNELYDSAYDYYELSLNKWASYNALPIIGGKVRDVNNVWSNDLYMTYEDWKARFYALRNKILTATY